MNRRLAPVRGIPAFAATLAVAALSFALLLAAPAQAAAPVKAPKAASLAIVVRDQTPLRAAPHDAAQQQAQLWQGEVVEVRGERLDYLQVWDYRRERGGFVETARVRRMALAASDAPQLLAVVRFVRDTPGAEALGIGFAAAYLKAATPEALLGANGAEAFDAIGTMADRMAQRASAGPPPGAVPGAPVSRADAALPAHLEVAARYGVVFKSYERDGAMRICYDGEAFRRVLAMPAADATERARAALGLTRTECMDPKAPLSERPQLDAWRADVLDRVDEAQLTGTMKDRIAMRRAGVWSGIAYQHARRGETAPAETAAKRALAELASVERGDLADEDQAPYNDAAIRVSASRWAAAPLVAKTARSIGIVTAPGEPGETCVMLVDARHDASSPLIRRCTYGIVWAASTSLNREGNALTLAVQPMDAWRELWVYTRKSSGTWMLQVLPPSTAAPELGYIEFAGWVPGGKQLLVAREARGDGKLKRSFEVVRLDTLSTDRQAGDPAVLGPFQRWQDAAWKRETVSVR
ncbi:MAG: hypothetical protein ABI330_01625 [Caldimonas sp.]